MKAFILLLACVIAGYIGWYVFPAAERKAFRIWIKPHAFRLGVIFAVLVVLAYAAYLLPSFRFT